MTRMTRVSFAAGARLALLAGLLSGPLAETALAQEAPSFAGKTITVIVGATVGGSTDIAARTIAPFIAKHLPGAPASVVQNRPGAQGLTAMNMFAQQVAPDGLTAIVGSGSQIDPINYRVPLSQYDPAKFAIIGGIDIGGSIILIRNESLPRLTDKTAAPVVVGTITGVPRSGMQMAAWGADHLGWNIKWITGYRGNPELMLAFERGEIDMTSFANTTLKPDLFDKTKYTILYQSGASAATVPATMPALAGVPLLSDAMKGKIADPLEQKAFQYWQNISSINNWVALPPNTPAPIVEAYRAAFRKSMADPEFLAQVARIGEDVTVLPHESMEKVIRTLATLPPEAFGYMKQTLARQGLTIADEGSTAR